MRTLTTFATLLVSLGLLVSGPVLSQPAMAAASNVTTGPDRAEVSTKLPDGLSESDWAGIRQAHTVERHRVTPLAGRAGVWHARNPGQAWRTRFAGRGFLVQPDAGEWTWGLELSRYGIADDQHEIGGEAPVTIEATRWAAKAASFSTSSSKTGKASRRPSRVIGRCCSSSSPF